MDQATFENQVILWDFAECREDANLDRDLHLCAGGHYSQGTECEAFVARDFANPERLSFRENPYILRHFRSKNPALKKSEAITDWPRSTYNRTVLIWRSSAWKRRARRRRSRAWRVMMWISPIGGEAAPPERSSGEPRRGSSATRQETTGDVDVNGQHDRTEWPGGALPEGV